MDNLLWIDACVNRETSRTERLSFEVLARASRLHDFDITKLVLEDEGLTPFDSVRITKRNALIEAGAFDDPMFKYANQLASADAVIVSSPYWDSGFSSLLKCWIEAASAVGVAYRYSDDGWPVGLCSARGLVYITTRGGYVGNDNDLGFATLKSLGELYGIDKVNCISVDGLDIVGNDVEAIMDDTIAQLDTFIESNPFGRPL